LSESGWITASSRFPSDDEKKLKSTDIPDHSVAVKMLLDKLTKFNIIKDLNEIDGIGHRVVHGGEKFSDSVLLTDEMIHEIEEISELAPLHNPANIVGIKAFKEVLPNVPADGRVRYGIPSNDAGAILSIQSAIRIL
jgi:acetate kinase